MNKKNIELYEKYKELAIIEETKRNVYFIGRLANYKYFNMDQAILSAIETFQKIERKTMLYQSFTVVQLFFLESLNISCRKLHITS